MTTPEFTGERFIPGCSGPQLAYEHLHRYLYAARWARGRRVLDVASGSGYGAALLAGSAKRVWAMDLHGPTVALSRRSYYRENLHFVQADATRLPFGNGAADLVVALEVIEHLADQEGLVREIARVVLPSGAALISTPDKSAYSDARHYTNPFHVHEFHSGEFVALLERHFPRVRLMRQQVRAGSLITWESNPQGTFEIITQPAADEKGTPSEPMYLLALCGGDGIEPAPSGSAYLDLTDALFAEWIGRLNDSIALICNLNKEIGELGRWARGLEQDVGERDRAIVELQELLAREVKSRDWTIRDLQETSERDIAQRDQSLIRLQNELEERTHWAMSLTEDVSLRDRQLDHVNSELEKAARQLSRIRHAFLYRVLCRMGLLPK